MNMNQFVINLIVSFVLVVGYVVGRRQGHVAIVVGILVGLWSGFFLL